MCVGGAVYALWLMVGEAFPFFWEGIKRKEDVRIEV